MIDPWRFVESDDDMVADFLAGTVEAVLELGGWLHPAARIVARDGQIAIEFEGDAGAGDSTSEPTPLLRIPATAFIRITRVDWSASDEALEMDGLRGELEPAELELLIMQMALHNSCGKIAWMSVAHPALAAGLSKDIVDAVRAFAPDFKAVERTPAEVFWGNRVLRLPTVHSAIPEPVAVPILDLLNHHRAGATGTWTGDGFEVTASLMPGGAECALDYGYGRDAMEMAADYGFVDTSATSAHSAAVEVEVDGLGTVSVARRRRTGDGSLEPMRVTQGENGWHLSGLTFAGGIDPTGELAAESGWSEQQARAATTAVAQANLDRLDALISLAGATQGPAAGVLADAARVQRGIVGEST